MKLFKKAVAVAALSLAVSGVAQATPVEWSILGNTTIGGEPDTLWGRFTYDADTNVVSNSYLSAYFQSKFFTYPSGSYFTVKDNVISLEGADGSWYAWVFSITPNTVRLTNAGGIFTANSTCSNVSNCGGMVTIAAKAAATAVPEPEAYAMMLAGLGLVGFAARRKISA